MATQSQAPEELVERVQDLLGSLDEIADPVAQARVQELVGAVLELYGAGLERILGVIADAGEGAIHIRKALLDDGIVASLLLIHGLYPVPLEERIAEAVESVRPFLASHGGGVEILSVEDGVARLAAAGQLQRLSGVGVDARARVEGGDRRGRPRSARARSRRCRGPRSRRTSPPIWVRAADGAGRPGDAADGRRAIHRVSVGRGEVSGTGRLPSTLVAGLGRLARPEPVVEDEQCEVCGSRISEDHRHLLELEERRILCACEPCIAMRSGVDNYCPVGTRTRVARRHRLPRRAVVGVPAADRAGVLPAVVGHGHRRGALSEPRGRDRVRAAPGELERARRAQPRAAAARGRRRGVRRQPHDRPARARDRADRRVLPPRRAHQGQLDGHLGRQRHLRRGARSSSNTFAARQEFHD